MGCKKCKSEDIVTRFVDKGTLIDSSSLRKVSTEFISSSEYDLFYKLTAGKEHLHKHCRNCQYSWRENTADNAA